MYIEQINKSTARKLFNSGERIIFIALKGNNRMNDVEIIKSPIIDDFDKFYNSFIYYNKGKIELFKEKK